MRQVLTDMGFDEAISYSFINTAYDNDFELVPGLLDDRVEEKFVTLRDSVIEGAVRMRATILPGLLDAVRHNFNHQRRDVRMFELGKVFASKLSETGLPTEQETLTLVLSGGDVAEDRALSSRELDFFDAKGAVEAALEATGSTTPSFEAATVKHLRDGQAARIIVNGKPVGTVGRLADDIAANYKFRQPVYCAEIDIQTVLKIPQEQITYAPLARFPSVIRDVSFTVKRSMSYSDVRKAVLDQNFELCKEVMFVDIYEGKGLADDERSLTIRIEYRSDDRTLVESEVEAVHQRILEGVENSLGVLVRG
jgi:phenylalanyl-tRNA synthetase beta chain